MARVLCMLLGCTLYPSLLFGQEITAPVAAPPHMAAAPMPSSGPAAAPALSPVPVLPREDVFADVDDFSGFDLGELLTVKVETASRRSQRLADAPARIVVVTRSQIEQRQYVNLADLLADLPGVDVFRNTSEEAHDSIAIRGNTGNNKFVILQDGRRLTPLTGEPLAIEDNYPLDAAKQVEVIYGPASALYGADAFTGIINIITHEGADQAATRVAGAYGTTQYRRGSLTGSVPLSEHLRLKYGGHWHAADNSDLQSAYPNDVALGSLLDPLNGKVIVASRNDRYSNRTGSYSVNANLLFDDKFSAGYDHRSYTHMTATGVQPAYALYGKSWWRTRNQLFFADYRTPITSKLSNETGISYSTSDLDPNTSFTNFYSNYRKAFKYMSNQTISAREQLAFQINDDHNLIGGLAWSDTNSLPKTADLAKAFRPEQSSVEQGFTYPVAGSVPIRFYQVRFQDVGAYSQIQSKWTNLFSTTLGVRYDYDTRFGSTVNPRAGANLNVSDKQSLKLLYGESYLAPSTFNMYQHYGAFTSVDGAGKAQSFFFHVPNPNLKPEKARTVEANYTGLYFDRFGITASAYYTIVEQIVLNTFSPAPVDFAGGRVSATESAQNSGQAKLRGGDLMLNYQNGVGSVNINQWVSYTLSKGMIDDGTARGEVAIPYNAEHKFKGGVTLERKGYSVTPRMRFSSPTTSWHFKPGINSRTRVLIPSYYVYDITLLARDLFTKGLSLAVDVPNVLDRRYYHPGGENIIDFVRAPQEGRQIRTQLAYGF